MSYTQPTTAEVKGIMSNKAAVPDDLSSFITTADVLVQKISGLPDSELTEICKYLAAHLASLPYPIVRQSVSVGGGAATNYQRGLHGMGLDYTPYGQMVKVLDTTGTLVQLDAQAKQRTASLEAYGGHYHPPRW